MKKDKVKVKNNSRKKSKKESKKNNSRKKSKKNNNKISRKLTNNLDFLVKSYDLLKDKDKNIDVDYELLKDIPYELLDELGKEKYPIVQTVNNSNNNLQLINNKTNIYEIDDLNNIIDEFDKIKKSRDIFQKKYGVYKNTKMSHQLAMITKNMSKNLSLYINKNFFNYDNIKGVSNAYVKLWEIYNLYMKDIIKSISSDTFSIFHTCEAPGNWIKTTEHYIKMFYPNIKYKWFANSLNPKSPINIAKYGTGIFADNLSYMKNYPDRWLFGPEDTGDITDINNIKIFSKFSKENNVMIITNDAGLSTDMGIELLQKLEYASVINTIACSSIGGCCIIKHFATGYFYNENNLMKLGNGYSVNIIYLYQQYFNKVIIMKPVTSNPRSSEYYIIGIGFKGISDEELNILYNVLQNFNNETINQCVFNKAELNTQTLSDISNGIKKILELNLNQNKIQLLIWRCNFEENKDIQIEQKCNDVLKYHYKFEIPLFKKWIQTNNYIPTK